MVEIAWVKYILGDVVVEVEIAFLEQLISW
jgi:hypothetical protein